MTGIRKLLALSASLLGVCATASGDELLQSAQQLLNSDRPRDALLALAPLEGQRAGEVDYDYLLGLATLDSGDPGKAVLILERVLALQPAFHGARLDYARALFATGRYSEAEVEFRRVAASKPPPAARRAVDDYLAQIDSRNRRLKFSYFIDVRTRGGYDSNVNSATELDEFLGFGLNATSREQDSDFFEVGLGAGAAYRPEQGLTIDGRLKYLTRKNGQASFADSDILAGSLRVRSDTPVQRRVAALQAFALDIDGEENNSAVILNGQWEFLVGGDWWLGGAVRYGAIRYGSGLKIKDVDQLVLAATASRSFGALDRGLLRAGIGIGQDDPTESGSRYARDFLVADVGINWRFTGTLTGAVSASVEESDYDEVFFEQLYDDARNDTRWRGRGSLDWRFARNWRFRHTLTYTLNDTEVLIFEYERFEFGVGLNYVWD